VSRLSDRLQKALGSRYRLEERLGAGAMGVVYRAFDPSLQRAVAIKLLRPELATETGAARFLREARCLAQISHPNLVSVHEVAESDGLFYYVMDLLDGETLADRLLRGPLSDEEFRATAEQLLTALEAVHDAGIVHRDVKPENLFLTGDRVILSDFGVAKSDSGTATLTAAGRYIGTPAYSAPEQFSGCSDDTRSDLFAAAAVLFEATTGKRWQHLDPVSDATWEGVPPALRLVIARGLKVSLDDRWEDAASFRTSLLEALAAPGEKRGRRLALAAVTLAVVALIALTVREIEPDSTGSAEEITSVAVLPCDGGGQEEGGLLAILLAEGLRRELGMLRLDVPGRHSVVGFSAGGDIRGIGDSLSVQSVFECATRVTGDSIRVSGQLYDAATGFGIPPAIEMEVGVEDSWRMVDSVTRVIVEAISPLLAAGLGPRPTAGPPSEAYYLYGRGIQAFTGRSGSEAVAALQTAQRRYEEALEVDSTFALAWAGLAEVYLARPGRALASSRAAYPDARRFAETARRLDPGLAEPYVALGETIRAYDRDRWVEGDALFRQAIALNPGLGFAHLWYAIYLAQSGRLDSALAHAHAAVATDPRAADLTNGLGIVLYLRGDNEEAAEVFRETIRAHPGELEARMWLAAPLIEMGEDSDAVATLDLARERVPRVFNPILAAGYAGAGRDSIARALLDEVALLLPEDGSPSPFWAGVALAQLGDDGDAMESMERAYAERDEHLAYLNVLPLLRPLRQNPQFRDRWRDFVEEVGIPARSP